MNNKNKNKNKIKNKEIESLIIRTQIKTYINNQKYDEATEQIQKLSDLNPPGININFKEIGELYESQRMYSKAISCYVKILNDKRELIPLIYQITNQVGICYFNIESYKLAVHYFNKVLKINEHPDVYNNIGQCYSNSKNYNDAIIAFFKSYNINSNSKASANLGLMYYYIRDYDKSIDFFLKTEGEHLPGLALSYLGKKDFIKGFELYENRLNNNPINKQTNCNERVDIILPTWNCEDNCEKLLIISEQGLGDNIQYYRFIIELSEKYPNMKITFFCKKEIAHLFEIYTNIDIIKELYIPTLYNYKLFIMSLPYILKTSSIESNKINYIKTNDHKMKYWKDTTSRLTKFKVGIVYNGLLTSFIDKFIPLEKYKILCDLNIDLICIHKKNEIICDLGSIDFKDKMIHYDIDTDIPFEDTVCLLQNIDLLITVDTFTVHLAGILNVKTWLLLGASEWRWSDNKDKPYWYDSVEFIRTQKDEKFVDILSTVKNKLLTII